MREILFRGKAKDGYKWIEKGEWIEGSLLYSDDENGTVCQIATSYLSRNKDEPVMAVAYEVDPETVCQYTGLTDKNGRKIFEGDIINDIDYGIMKCIYLHGSFVWYKEDGFRIECMKYVPVIEVIGNIFDNPELIGDRP